MRTHRVVPFALVPVVAIAMLLPSVYGGEPLERWSGSTVRIVAIDPPSATLLRPGERLHIAATVEYFLAVEKGRIHVFVQCEESRVTVTKLQGQSITAGKGTAVVSAEIEVPRTGELQFIAALYHPDSTSTAVTSSRTYHVATTTP